jgi:hypothetical protein
MQLFFDQGARGPKFEVVGSIQCEIQNTLLFRKVFPGWDEKTCFSSWRRLLFPQFNKSKRALEKHSN